MLSMFKSARDIWAWLCGGTSTITGYVQEQDFMFWLGLLVIIATLVERLVAIVLNMTKWRKLREGDSD